MQKTYGIGDIVLGRWNLVRFIGEGGFGSVFEATRESYGVKNSAAIKIMTVTKSAAEMRNAKAEGMSDDEIIAGFRTFVEEIVSEVTLMSKLKGTANVVGYEDHEVIEHGNGISCDIIIRMELLTPLFDYCKSRPFSRQDVIRLGIDICRALELCREVGIIHRDIKPENILVSGLGNYKLGDFGIARTLEKTGFALSKKGTYPYMAPEVFSGMPYGFSVDIYSLGIVLYSLLNYNRTPFLPPRPVTIAESDRRSADTKRFGGAAIPPPINADGRLAEIILKACAFKQEDRYEDPAQMRLELEAILNDSDRLPIIYQQGDAVSVESIESSGGIPTPEDTLPDSVEPAPLTEVTWEENNPAPFDEPVFTLPLDEPPPLDEPLLTMPLDEPTLTMPLDEPMLTLPIEPLPEHVKTKHAPRPNPAPKHSTNPLVKFVAVAFTIIALIVFVAFLVGVFLRNSGEPTGNDEPVPPHGVTSPAPTPPTTSAPTPTPAPSPPTSEPTEPTPPPQTAQPDYITIREVQYSTALTTLSLPWLGLTDAEIEPLRFMTNLTELRLEGNQISDVTPLAGLTELRELTMFFNQISDITPLAGLVNLTLLNLAENQISDITPLSGLTNLTRLPLWGNQISDITPLAGLTGLMSLDLTSNRISSITPLAGLTNLTWIGLENNQITDWSPVVNIERVDGRP